MVSRSMTVHLLHACVWVSGDVAAVDEEWEKAALDESDDEEKELQAQLWQALDKRKKVRR